MERNLILGGKHTMQMWNCTLETYWMLLMSPQFKKKIKIIQIKKNPHILTFKFVIKSSHMYM